LRVYYGLDFSFGKLSKAKVSGTVMYNDHTAFIKGLMQEIRSVSLIKDGEDERLMDYYMLLQSHIEEAHRAVLVSMLLIPANMEEMVLTLPNWEKSIWEK
jgi:hypothetical protein